MIVHAIVDGRTTYEVELDENSGRYYLVEKIGMKRQTGRILLKSWGYVAACGEAEAIANTERTESRQPA